MLPPPLGRREENRCQERARAAGRIILDGLQEVPEERLEKNRPLDTSQWMRTRKTRTARSTKVEQTLE